jgi:hypothetical protein
LDASVPGTTELRYLMGTGPSVDTLPPLRARRLDCAALLALYNRIMLTFDAI